MVLFIYFDLKNLVLNLKLFIKSEVIDECQTAFNFLKIDLNVDKIVFKLTNVTLGFASETSPK